MDNKDPYCPIVLGVIPALSVIAIKQNNKKAELAGHLAVHFLIVLPYGYDFYRSDCAQGPGPAQAENSENWKI